MTDLVFVGAPMNFGTWLVQRASDPLVSRFLSRMASPESAVASDRDEPDLDIVQSAADLFAPSRAPARPRIPAMSGLVAIRPLVARSPVTAWSLATSRPLADSVAGASRVTSP